MNNEKLDRANKLLRQNEISNKKKTLWLILSIMVGITIISAFIIFWWLKTTSTSSTSIGPSGSGETYPYIPHLKNTIRSSSGPELFSNVLLDMNESAIDYSVISRTDLQN